MTFTCLCLTAELMVFQVFQVQSRRVQVLEQSPLPAEHVVISRTVTAPPQARSPSKPLSPLSTSPRQAINEMSSVGSPAESNLASTSTAAVPHEPASASTSTVPREPASTSTAAAPHEPAATSTAATPRESSRRSSAKGKK